MPAGGNVILTGILAAVMSLTAAGAATGSHHLEAGQVIQVAVARGITTLAPL